MNPRFTPAAEQRLAGALWILLCLLWPACLSAQSLTPPGPVLKLQEQGRYLELPPDVFNDFTESTIEAWVKFNTAGGRCHRLFSYGTNNRDINILTETGKRNLWLVIVGPGGALQIANGRDAVRAGEWMHLAGVTGSDGMKLYINGVLAATNPYQKSFSSLGEKNLNRIGQSAGKGEDNTPFDGEVAEFRVWRTARTVEQIRDNLTK